MKVIWKYELQLTDRQTIPIGDRAARPLAVAEQNEKLVMWIEHDSSCFITGDFAVYVEIFGTGRIAQPTGEYLGTVRMSSGFVWHVYTSSANMKGAQNE